MSNLKDLLIRFRDGDVDFGEFVYATKSEFRAMACHLTRRWTPPEWFTVDDVEQELYLAVWKYVWTFDETRGVAFDRYVVFNAMSCAKTQLHKARGVTISGSPDRKLSNIETPLTFFGDEGEGELLMMSVLSESPKAENQLIEHEERKHAVTLALKACTTPNERYTVLAIREAGSLDAASTLLYDDIDHRITLRLSSEDHADRFVLRHASAIAQRVEVQAD